MPTPKQQLLELTYQGDLADDIARALAAGKSWREIRHDVETRTGLHVSHESLRNWYHQPTPPSSAPSKVAAA